MIKIDISMPSCCNECFALDDTGDYPTCLISHDSRGYNFNTHAQRMPSCPLIDGTPCIYEGTIDNEKVHCKDCKYWFEDRERCEYFSQMNADGEWEYSIFTNAEDYCSKGELE